MTRKSQEWAIKLVPTREERRLLDRAARQDGRLTGPYCLLVALEAARAVLGSPGSAQVAKGVPGPSNGLPGGNPPSVVPGGLRPLTRSYVPEE